MADAVVLRADGLTKHFGAVKALEDLDLELHRGEVFGFLGPNGAGKTTTVRLFLDFIRPTRGSATVLGLPPSDPASRARVGYLPAELHIDERYSANDVVAFLGHQRGGVDQALVSRLLDRFGLDPSRPLGLLSTGNKRKIGIVAAFMHRPELLLLDEPTSGLDPLLQHEFQALVRESVADGASVLLSSHVLPEVELLAERVAIVKEGRLVALDRIDAMRRQARQRIDLHLAEPVDPARFHGVPGVVEVDVVGSAVQCVVEGSVDPLLKATTDLHVLRIVSHDTDLEDIFLRYYRGDS